MKESSKQCIIALHTGYIINRKIALKLLHKKHVDSSKPLKVATFEH